MKLGAEDRKKLIAAGAFGVLAIGYLAYTLAGTGNSSSDAPATPATVAAPSRSTSAAPAAATPAASMRTASRLDPTLHPEGMLLAESLVYSGSGRNIFLPAGESVVAKTPRIPAPVTTARYVPPPVVNSGPAAPPPIDLKFFGTVSSRDGKRQAFLLKGEDVLIGAPGEIVGRRYKVGAVSASSVEITDLTNNNTQRLPMSTQ